MDTEDKTKPEAASYDGEMELTLQYKGEVVIRKFIGTRCGPTYVSGWVELDDKSAIRLRDALDQWLRSRTLDEPIVGALCPRAVPGTTDAHEVGVVMAPKLEWKSKECATESGKVKERKSHGHEPATEGGQEPRGKRGEAGGGNQGTAEGKSTEEDASCSA